MISKPDRRPYKPYDQSQFTTTATGNLTAFASDLEWPPGFFPGSVTITTKNGVYTYHRHTLDETGAYYRHVSGQTVSIFND